MTTKDEALKQALAALEDIHPGNMTPMAEKAWDTAITVCRDAMDAVEIPHRTTQAQEVTHEAQPCYT